MRYIIIINGCSSSGKTNLCKLLIEKLEYFTVHIGIDTFWTMMPKKYIEVGSSSLDGFYFEKTNNILNTKIGPNGRDVLNAIPEIIKSLFNNNMNLVMDDIILDFPYLKNLLLELKDLPVYFIYSHCPLWVLKKREYERQNRMIGLTEGQYNILHNNEFLEYDLILNSHILNRSTMVSMIMDHVHNYLPYALNTMLQKL